MSIADIIAIAAIVITIIGTAYQVFRNKNQDTYQLQNRVVTLETKMTLFWALMEQHAATILHHPTMIERDKLIDGYLANTLTMDQVNQFITVLNDVIKDATQAAGDRLAASFLLTAVYHRYGFNEA